MDATIVTAIARREEILRRIRRVLIERLKVRREPDEIDPDAPLFGSGLGLDSIDAVELLVSLQVEFALRLSGDTVGPASMRTVNTLVDLILELKDQGCGSE